MDCSHLAVVNKVKYPVPQRWGMSLISERLLSPQEGLCFIGYIHLKPSGAFRSYPSSFYIFIKKNVYAKLCTRYLFQLTVHDKQYS